MVLQELVEVMEQTVHQELVVYQVLMVQMEQADLQEQMVQVDLQEQVEAQV